MHTSAFRSEYVAHAALVASLLPYAHDRTQQLEVGSSSLKGSQLYLSPGALENVESAVQVLAIVGQTGAGPKGASFT